MKIVIGLEIEVDPVEWHRLYGNGDQPLEVRKDVRQAVLAAVRGFPGLRRAGGTVRLRSRPPKDHV